MGIDPSGLWTISISREVSGGAVAGGTYQESYVWDGSSLLPEKQATVGVGAFGGYGLSGTVGLNFTNAPSASNLTGQGLGGGASGGEGVVGGIDFTTGVTQNPDGTETDYQGAGLNLGLGLGTPVEVHVFETDTVSLGRANLWDLLQPAKPFFWDALPYFNKKPYTDPVKPQPPHPNGNTTAVTSQDPNALTGPGGFGSAGFVAAGTTLPYRIDFENSTSATAPAQRVTITDQLSTDLDWSTFELTGAGFGGTILNIPDNSQSYQTTVAMTENGVTFDVEVQIGLDQATGLLTAVFQSIDPATNLPPGLLTGFLPPEDGTGRGMGFVSFLIDPKAGLPTGTQITDVADIVFDGATPIATDQANDEDPSQGIDPAKMALVTIDAGAPSSAVATLPPTENTATFTVSWSGQDDAGGSGVADYDVYVSDNGGAFTPFQTGTSATSSTFSGQDGHTYAFYSVATDNAGIVQPTPAAAQTSTTVHVSTSSQPATPTIAWATPADITYGTPLGQNQLDATASFDGTAVSGTFTYSKVMGIVLAAGTGQELTVSFVPTDANDFSSAMASVAINVAPAPLTVTANDATRATDQLNPTFTAKFSRFVNGDGPASLGGTLVLRHSRRHEQPPRPVSDHARRPHVSELRHHVRRRQASP